MSTKSLYPFDRVTEQNSKIDELPLGERRSRRYSCFCISITSLVWKGERRWFSIDNEDFAAETEFVLE